MTNPIATTGRPRTLAAFSNFFLDHDDLDLILDKECRLIAGTRRTEFTSRCFEPNPDRLPSSALSNFFEVGHFKDCPTV
ncbi:hypothetical protein O4D10_10510 [Xanthomonas citri pv. citri]|uniref:hypothetical protein n=1 Tax=Xanthomonas citri TaxID=346 RepID=UPI0036DB9BFC